MTPACIRNESASPALVVLALASIVALFSGCSHLNGKQNPISRDVRIADGVPATTTNAVLVLDVYVPSYVSPMNGGGAQWGGRRSIQHPFGSLNYGNWVSDERLIAITTDGFEVLLRKTETNTTVTESIVFPFDEITETNAFGWRIKGRFE
jgi:hypothetical protein